MWVSQVEASERLPVVLASLDSLMINEKNQLHLLLQEDGHPQSVPPSLHFPSQKLMSLSERKE